MDVVRTRRDAACGLAEHLVDETVGPAPLAAPFLVVARDQLGEEPQRKELHADDDEQHAEREERAVADRLAADLEHGEVDEDAGAEGEQQEAEPAEQVEGAVPVSAHERDGQQVEEAAYVALDPVARATVLARAVIDRELCDPEAAVVREHWDVAVQLAVQPQPADHLSAVRLEATVHVVQTQARQAAADPVEQLRGDATPKWIAALRLPAADEVESLVELRE